ncbi:MAG: LysM peptidoglycan-binding domain-containing protein [Bacteroides sp.]|nr:LysM peptidoglycan-binding domain-containing protein [Bacteroides sp.]
MAVQDKYGKLIDYARQAGVQGLSIKEENNVLHIDGSAPTSVKDQMWNIYNQIDPEMRSGDLVLNIHTTDANTASNSKEEVYEVRSGDSLSKIAARYPGMTWNKIMEANKDQIKDPNRIYPGQKIRIPL